MNDWSELKRLAEAVPDLDWDSQFEDHEQTGFCTVFAKQFEIDGEMHDGPVFIERCTAEQAQFIAGSKVAVLALIAENERLKANSSSMRGSVKRMGKDVSQIQRQLRKSQRERDHLKAENEALRLGATRYQWVRSLSPDPQGYDQQVDIGMRREVGHG